MEIGDDEHLIKRRVSMKRTEDILTAVIFIENVINELDMTKKEVEDMLFILKSRSIHRK